MPPHQLSLVHDHIKFLRNMHLFPDRPIPIQQQAASLGCQNRHLWPTGFWCASMQWLQHGDPALGGSVAQVGPWGALTRPSPQPALSTAEAPCPDAV